MNIFVPQSIQTQIELEEIADVKRQIISPSSSRTSIGLVQDGLLGAYNLTAPTTQINWRNSMNLIGYTSFDQMNMIKKDKIYTGQELFSLIIPPGINISQGNFKVKDSVIQPGSRLNKDVLGEKKNFALHQLIWDEYGPDETKSFIDNSQKLTNNFNLYNGFTVGYGDTSIKSDIKDSIDIIFQTKIQKINHMITEQENNPEIMDKYVFEFKLMQEMGMIVLDTVSKNIMANLDPNNNFNIMVSSGSKGSAMNIGQVIGCVGFQAVENKLSPKKYNQRTLPYFHQNDDRIESRGLIREPYIDGLTFPSFFHLLVSGREGIIDGAIKTAETGYAQRRLVKSMEDIMIKYDYSVRTANDTLLQLVYGDNGSDTTKQYTYDIKLGLMSNEQIESKFKFTSDELKSFKNFTSEMNNKMTSDIFLMRETFRHCMMKAKCDFKSFNTKVSFPLNFSRIIDNHSANNELKKGPIVDPLYVLTKIEEILQNKFLTLIPMSSSDQSNPSSIKNYDERIYKTFTRIALYDSLSPKRCSIERKLTLIQFDTIINDIISTYNRSVVQPGEMIGTISAQSLGETITQMTLNTFHSAGIKTMSGTTQGVPRIREILGVSKSIKTPRMIIQLDPLFKKSKEMAHKVASNLKYTTIKDIRGRINIYYDPFPMDHSDTNTSVMKVDNIKHVFYNQKSGKNSCQKDITGLPWLMRIEIIKEKMLDKEISLLDIKSKFCNWWEKRFADTKLLRKEEKRIINKITSIAVLSNTDNDAQPVIHLRFNVKDVDKQKDPFNREMLNEFIDQIIDRFKMKGIESISDIPDIAPERLIIIDEATKDIRNEDQYVIYTSGVNLLDIRYIIGIDIKNTVCNDIYETYKHFGIEIARSRLIREIDEAYTQAGHSVSYTNLSILVDTMTSGGMLMSIDRHGMNKSDTDVLGRASFERAVDQILTAGVFGEVDHMRGVSSRIMGGLIIKGGTGFCDVILDTQLIEKSEYDDNTSAYQEHMQIQTDSVATDIIRNDVEPMFIPI